MTTKDQHISTLKPILDTIWYPCKIGPSTCGFQKDALVITGDGLIQCRYTIGDDGKCILDRNSGRFYSHIPLETPVDFQLIHDAAIAEAGQYSVASIRKGIPAYKEPVSFSDWLNGAR
jgi:hypothetical protein